MHTFTVTDMHNLCCMHCFVLSSAGTKFGLVFCFTFTLTLSLKLNTALFKIAIIKLFINIIQNEIE